MFVGSSRPNEPDVREPPHIVPSQYSPSDNRFHRRAVSADDIKPPAPQPPRQYFPESPPLPMSYDHHMSYSGLPSVTGEFHSPRPDISLQQYAISPDPPPGVHAHSPSRSPLSYGVASNAPGYGALVYEQLQGPLQHQHDLPNAWPGSSQSILKLSTIKKNNEKKQTLACLFCRERKIACGRPAEGSIDPTCK